MPLLRGTAGQVSKGGIGLYCLSLLMRCESHLAGRHGAFDEMIARVQACFKFNGGGLAAMSEVKVQITEPMHYPITDAVWSLAVQTSHVSVNGACRCCKCSPPRRSIKSWVCRSSGDVSWHERRCKFSDWGTEPIDAALQMQHQSSSKGGSALLRIASLVRTQTRTREEN